MTTQLAVKLSDSLVQEIDRLIETGRFANRTDAVRTALAHLLDQLREEQVSAAIVDGYRRMPQDEADDRWADAATRAMIMDEPWQ